MLASNLSASLVLGVAAAIGASEEQKNSLEALRDEYARIKSVHLKATANVTRRDKPGDELMHGTLRFEYWANERGFRVSCSADRSLRLLEDVEWSFDGSSYQLLDVDNRQLVLTANGAREYPVACPNPLFLMIQFISDREASCLSTCVKLPDLWRRESLKYTRRVLPDGSEQYAVGSQFEVVLSNGQSGVRPRSLRVLHPSGRKAGDITPTRFRETVVGPLPTRLTGRSFADDARSTWLDTVDITIQELEINRPVDVNRFKLDWASADQVLDVDTGRYVVHPRLDEANDALRKREATLTTPPKQP